MGELFGILITLVLLGLGFSVGTIRERRHLNSLAQREQEYADIQVSNLKAVPAPDSVRLATMVSGEAVIATDYFKSFAARLRNLIGGEVRAFESLMRRARREALLRMLAEARALGATEVWNIRLESSNILSARRNNPGASVEIFAVGTAIVRTSPP